MKSQQSIPRRYPWLVVISTAASACASSFQPPARNAGPSVSPEGVEVEVVKQICAPPEPAGADKLTNDGAYIELQVAVHDATVEPLVVHREKFRLVTPAGGVADVWIWGLRDPLILRPGETRSFTLRFEPYGDVECSREMGLDAESTIFLRDKAVHLGTVKFVPWRA
jgi:hypothetical protein